MRSLRDLTRQQQYLLGGVVVVIVLIAVVLIWRRGSHQQELQTAFIKLADASTFQAKTELLLHFPELLNNRQRPFNQVKITVAGDVQRTQSGTPELTGQLYIGATGPGTELYADGDVRIFDTDMAFYLQNLPILLNRSGNLIKKWTYVETPLLQTKNRADITTTLTEALGDLRYEGKTTYNKASVYQFGGTFTPEHKDRLAQVLHKQASGNEAFHILTRLLQANDLDRLDIYVDTDRNVQAITARFATKLRDGTQFQSANLTIELQDFGKEVTIDRPVKQLTVQPSVFSSIFGKGEVGTP